MNSLKVGMVIILGKAQNPSKVTQVDRATPGKHGHAQYSVFGRDLITGKKVHDLFGHHDHYIEVPVELSSNNMGVGVDEDGYMTYCDLSSGEYCYDLKVDVSLYPKVDPLDCTVIVRTLKWERGDKEIVDKQIVKLE